MKSLRLFFALLPLAFIACDRFEEIDLGFPQTVEFSKEGGEMIVSSEKGEYFTHAEIRNYKNGEEGEISILEDGTQCCTYKWLRVEYQRNSNDIKIIVEPNNTQSRKLHIELYSGDKYHTIEVFQEAHHLLE